MSGVNHNDLAGIGTSDHHVKTTSAEILLASMGEKNHSSLDNVTPSQHHTKTTSIAEITDIPNTIANMLTDHNKANHDALGLDHASLSNVLASQHHVKTVSADILLASMGEKNHSSLTGVSSDQHHARLHQIAGAADHAGTANVIIYVDGAGNVQELTLGTSGHHLRSNGLGAAPSWEAPPSAGVTGSGTQYYLPRWASASVLEDSGLIENAGKTLLTYGGNLRLNGNILYDSGGLQALTLVNSSTLTATQVTVNGDLRINGNDIKDGGGTTRITLGSTYCTFAGDIRLNGNDIRDSAGTVRITLGSYVTLPNIRGTSHKGQYNGTSSRAWGQVWSGYYGTAAAHPQIKAFEKALDSVCQIVESIKPVEPTDPEADCPDYTHKYDYSKFPEWLTQEEARDEKGEWQTQQVNGYGLVKMQGLIMTAIKELRDELNAIKAQMQAGHN